MSNIYIQEPPTSGKVLLRTTVGDIDIELWAKECPKTCRNFIQLCMEGYYNDTIFHRVVKGFIVQGGDPCGDGTGGESIYGEPFKDEFHSRLRFARRGLLGMANSGKDDNGSQFFFTMNATPELQNQNTLFGKVTGDTLFNMLKLEEGLVDHNERPMYPAKILKTEILSNPFDNIVPRVLKKREEKKEKKKERSKAVKNFGLLSFGEEAEEDEEATNVFVKQNAGKAKSMHDAVDDPKLSKTVIKIDMDGSGDERQQLAGDHSLLIKEDKETAEERAQRIKDKLKSKFSTKRKVEVEIKQEILNSDEDELVTLEQEKKKQNEKKKEEIRQEILTIKKQYQTEKIKKELAQKQPEKDVKKDEIKDNDGNEYIKNFIEEKTKYIELTSKLPKGKSREEFTLSLLSKFRSKLETLKHKQDYTEATTTTTPNASHDTVVEQEIQNDDWLAHTLSFRDARPVVAKDASTKSDDWYDVYDPRNPLNKRKRGDRLSKYDDSDSSKRRK